MSARANNYHRIKHAHAPVPFESDEVNSLWHIYVTDAGVSVGWLDAEDNVQVERFSSIDAARAWVKCL